MKVWAFQWREYNSTHISVWRFDWTEDKAQVLTWDEFQRFKTFCSRFQMSLHEAAQ